MKKIIACTFFSVVLLGSSAKTQNLYQGRILDAQNLRPLANIVIGVNEKKVTSTNAAGQFSLNVSDDSLKLTVSGVGYQTRMVWLKKGQGPTLIYLAIADEQLPEITITGYENNRRRDEIPAPVGLLARQTLERFSNTSLVPVINTLPGVRMEERSPGSYRLSIRGSTLRSPFGVRNVKIYWNEIPFTDPSGNTYLNQLDFNNVGRIEVLKGPAGSLYGAGTGGVVLLENKKAEGEKTEISLGGMGGSYGLSAWNVSLQSGTEKQNTALTYTHQTSDGYREQTQMRREVLNLQTRLFADEKRTLSVNAFYGDLYYQTPGGLTKAQFEANPKQARPAAGTLKGAMEQQAAIYLKTANLGLSQQYDFNSQWSNRTAIYLSYTRAENPSIRNYERRIEPSFGGRSVTSYRFENQTIKGKLSFGAEFQSGYFTNKTFGNRKGVVDTLQTDDEIRVASGLVFGQVELDLPSGFFLTVGGSYNAQTYWFMRLNQKNPAWQKRSFDPVFSPRIALLKKISPQLSVYGSVSQGFSPPTIQEIRPSEGTFNNTLNAEKGVNYEGGVRGNFLKNRLLLEVTAFSFRLKETIVIRRTADGADYFTNAGDTKQQGLEVSLSGKIASFLKTWVSYAYQDFHFSNYISVKTDFSGNRLTGTPKQVLVAGVDVHTKAGFYTNVTLSYTDKIPLNDANTEFANAYTLLAGRVGYHLKIKRLAFDIFGGADNIFDQSYGLGPDLNATGNRFYNPAPKRNFYAGIKTNINLGKK